MRIFWKKHWLGVVALLVVAFIVGTGAQANFAYTFISEVILGESQNQFAPYTVSWNANKIAENKTELHTKWINYMDEQGLWKPIDITMRDDGGAFVMDKAPFIFRAPKTSTGEAQFVSNVRYDIVGRAMIPEAPTTMAIMAQGVADVPGELFDMTGDGVPESVLYPQAYPELDADLLYYVQHGTEPVLQKLVRFHRLIPDTDISFRIRTDRALTVEVPREIVAEVDGVPVVDETPQVDDVPEETPVETPPADEAPISEEPVETPAPVEETPVETPPASDVPVEEPIETPPAETPPADETPTETSAPVEETPVEAPAETPAALNETPTVTEAVVPTPEVLGETSETAVTIQALEEEGESVEEVKDVSFENIVKKWKEFRKTKQETLQSGSTASRKKGPFSFHDGDSMRGFGWRDPVMWDSGEKKERIEVTLERTSPTEFVLTKHIRTAFFTEGVVYPIYTDTTTTVFPAESSGTAGMDHFISGPLGIDWATVHDATSGALGVQGTLLSTQTRNNRGIPQIDRAHTGFDTSAIPDTDTISAATITIFITTIVNEENDGDDWINIVQSTPASNTDIVAGDYDVIGAVSNPTEGATRIDFGSLTASADNTWTMDATGIGWISKTGITNLGWREGHDAINTPLDGATVRNTILFSSADETGTDQDPTLTITHSEVKVGGGDDEEDSPDSFIID